jgi:hypothetical protein
VPIRELDLLEWKVCSCMVAYLSRVFALGFVDLCRSRASAVDQFLPPQRFQGLADDCNLFLETVPALMI